ncbi:hypothetical protein ACWCPQ_22535 [Nocardia sp. NPDC001965]
MDGGDGEIGLPSSFHFAARTLDRRQFRFDLRRARADLCDRLGETFDPVLDVLSHPDTPAVVRGSDHRRRRRVARCGAVDGSAPSMGPVVASLPGESFWQSAGFTVIE